MVKEVKMFNRIHYNALLRIQIASEYFALDNLIKQINLFLNLKDN